MQKYEVLFLDIDGTILRPDNTIEDSTKRAISEVKEKGIQVILATGRPLHEIKELADELRIDSFIGYNGAYGIYKGKDIFKEPMNPASLESIIQVANEHNHELVLYTSSKNYFTALHNPISKNFIKMFHLHKNEEYSSTIISDVLGVTIMTLHEDEQVHYKLSEGIHLSQVNIEGMHHCFDVIREKVNKGIGVKVLLDHLGFKRENAIAFGDGLNDKEMLSFVGEGFAMGNAHPDLFSYAKHKTTEVTNSGIYNGLKTLGLVE